MHAVRSHDIVAGRALCATGLLLVLAVVLAVTDHALPAAALAGTGYLLALPALCGGLALLGGELLRAADGDDAG